MITEKELNPWDYCLTPEQKENFYFHYYAVNEFRYAYKKPMYVSSGIRNKDDQIRIYREKNLRRKLSGLRPIKIPMKSSHLMAAATDFFDPGHHIYYFAEESEDLLIKLNIYIELKDYTLGWIHLQTVAPSSKERFFKPY